MDFLPPEACVAIRRVGSLSTSVDSDAPAEGVVVAVGPGAEFRPPEVKVGDRVYFGRRSGIEIDFGGEALLVVEEAELVRETGPNGS